MERPLEESGPESNAGHQVGGTANGKGATAFRPGTKGWPQGTKPVVEILCNDQVNISTLSNSTSRRWDWMWLFVVQ